MDNPTSIRRLAVAVGVVAALALLAGPLVGQWTNRYERVRGYGHHVYLEGYELPTMNAGPTAPAVSPDGRHVAFSARGWIWTLDAASGRATRVTDGQHMDFRPAWSPDGERIAFVRDDTRNTWIVVRDLESGDETTIDTPAIELDPAFGAGGALVYASASAGDIDLWRAGEPPAASERLTTHPGIEVGPSLSADGSVLVYVHKGGGDRIVVRDLASGAERELVSERIVSQVRPAVSPDGRLVAYNWATEDGYELRLLATSDPRTTVRLTAGRRGLPLEPAWSPDGEWIWFTEADADEVMRLYRVSPVGGSLEEVPIRAWDWGEDTGILRVTTRLAGAASAGGPASPAGGSAASRPVAARLEVLDAPGHPAVPSNDHPQFGVRDGRIFFYSPGVVDIVLPAGRARVSAVRGLATPEVRRTVDVGPGGVTEVDLTLEPVWDARAAGYLSGDHHFHLNYGGQYTLDPEDLFPMMAGEDLDVGTPLLANLHNRFEHRRLWGWENSASLPLIRFAQEVRSHFLGHVGLLHARSLYWPWIWGPGYQVYGLDDRPNAAPLEHARAEGGLGGYVHPLDDRDPFAPANHGNWPVMLAVDGILGTMDWIEIACLWTDELGTSEAWYRFLNLGVPIAAEAGTDVMNDFYRTMAVGTTRLYVQAGGATSFDAYWDGMREGRSFVTTGPMLRFDVEGSEHGGTVEGGRIADFRIDLASAIPVETVEILVNGTVAWVGEGLSETGERTYEGEVELPEGGWVAARVHGGEPTWPAMDPVVFAHTSPVWIGEVGSVDPEAARRAAEDLAPVVDAAEAQLRAAYGDTPIPRIDAYFTAAREKLRRAIEGSTP